MLKNMSQVVVFPNQKGGKVSHLSIASGQAVLRRMSTGEMKST